MSTSSLQYRSAKGCVGSGIKVDFTIQALENTIFITSQSKSTLHSMTLGVEIDGFLTGELYLYRSSHL